MAYLSCMNLSVGYAGAPVVCGIDFSVGPGDAVLVIGENGAGKTTLLRTLLGLQPKLSGEVVCDDGVASGKVGYLPQRSELQRGFPASAWEVVLSGRAASLGKRPFFSRADIQIAKGAMQRAGAYDLRKNPFSSLSGGQQQRVFLARALACEPLLLVLDEPTTGLDPEASDALYATIDDLRRDGVGILAVTHDVATALPHATHILEVRGGTAVYFPYEGEANAR